MAATRTRRSRRVARTARKPHDRGAPPPLGSARDRDHSAPPPPHDRGRRPPASQPHGLALRPPAPELRGPARAVLLAAALTPGDAALAELRALAPRLDWDAAVSLAIQAGLGPLVHRTVREHDLPAPEAARQRLRGAYAVNAIRNDAIMEEVLRVADLLEGRGIPAMPLKGACLIATLYPDPGLRVLSDIDLMVPRAHALAAERVLAETAGYERVEQGLLYERSHLFHHHVTFRRASTPFSFVIELHHRLLTSFARRLDQDGVWERARWMPYGGREATGGSRRGAAGRVRTLAPEDQALYLASHCAVHVCEPHHKWLVDLAALLATAPLDWDTVIARAHATGSATGVYETLRRLAAVLGVAVPDGVMRRLRPPAYVRAALARYVPLDIGLGGAPPPRWIQHAAFVFMHEGLGDRLWSMVLAAGYKVWLERSRR